MSDLRSIGQSERLIRTLFSLLRMASHRTWEGAIHDTRMKELTRWMAAELRSEGVAVDSNDLAWEVMYVYYFTAACSEPRAREVLRGRIRAKVALARFTGLTLQ